MRATFHAAKPLARRAIRRFGAAAAIAALLAGCQAGGASDDGREAPAPQARTAQLVERDVEAPEVFRTEAAALWDGRPSLGGVWVAAWDVRSPERVIIRNPENGRSVVGALFRREREMPGPPLQISSEAAAALGIIAGDPSEVSVTALRRLEVPRDAEPGPSVPEEPAAGGEAPEAADAPPAGDRADSGLPGIGKFAAT